jgi:hypothetical protein
MALHFDASKVSPEGRSSLQFVATQSCPLNGYEVGETYWNGKVFNIGMLFMVIGIKEITAKNIPTIISRSFDYFDAINYDFESLSYYYGDWNKEGLQKLVGLSFNIYPTTAKEWSTDLERIRRNNRRSA